MSIPKKKQRRDKGQFGGKELPPSGPIPSKAKLKGKGLKDSSGYKPYWERATNKHKVTKAPTPLTKRYNKRR